MDGVPARKIILLRILTRPKLRCIEQCTTNSAKHCLASSNPHLDAQKNEPSDIKDKNG